jgi:hypothetical protein
LGEIGSSQASHFRNAAKRDGRRENNLIRSFIAIDAIMIASGSQPQEAEIGTEVIVTTLSLENSEAAMSVRKAIMSVL